MYPINVTSCNVSLRGVLYMVGSTILYTKVPEAREGVWGGFYDPSHHLMCRRLVAVKKTDPIYLDMGYVRRINLDDYFRYSLDSKDSLQLLIFVLY